MENIVESVLGCGYLLGLVVWIVMDVRHRIASRGIEPLRLTVYVPPDELPDDPGPAHEEHEAMLSNMVGDD